METRHHGIERRVRWETGSSAVLTVGSGVFLFGYSLVILDTDMEGMWRTLWLVLLAAIWASFIIDLVVRLALTPSGSRGAFLRSNSADAASVFVPLVRPFGLLRYLPRLPWLNGSSGDSVRSRLIISALAYVVLFVYTIALGVLAVERNAPGATILSFGDAVWWSVVTISTVGYGDYAPVTVVGRMLAVVLMAGGVAIIGTASATIVSFLNERITHSRRSHSDHPGDSSH